jgi:hypothetical protein
MSRFLSALIFLRRAKRKLVLHVELVALAPHGRIDGTNRIPAIDSREESFGLQARIWATEGENLSLKPERFFSLVSNT